MAPIASSSKSGSTATQEAFGSSSGVPDVELVGGSYSPLLEIPSDSRQSFGCRNDRLAQERSCPSDEHQYRIGSAIAMAF